MDPVPPAEEAAAPGAHRGSGAERDRPLAAPWRPAAALAGVLVAGLACYGRTLDVPWYFDDFPGIVDNPVVHHLGAALGGLLSPRGLGNLTFALDWAAWGPSLAAFHATNVAIHLAAGGLALLVASRVFPGRLDLATLAALVFVVHPVQTQAVTYVVQRFTSLAGLLALAATWLYLVARARLARGASPGTRSFLAPYLGALAAGAAAMLAKENAATLPLLLAACELLPAAGAGAARPWRRLAWVLPFAVFPAYLAARALGGWVLSGAGAAALPAPLELDVVGDGVTSRLAYLSTEMEVVWRYLRLLVWPVGQVFDFGLPVAADPFGPRAVAAGLGLAALAAAAVAARRWEPVVSFGALWFLGGLAVESSVIPLDPYFEHRLYLPMLGASACLVAILGRVARRPRALAVAGVAAVALLAGLTIRRNEQWRDPVALWSADVEGGSMSYRSAFGLADAHFARGDAERARRAYADLLARGRGRCQVGVCGAKYLYNLGVAAERLDDLRAAGELYQRAIQADASYGPARFGLGVVAYRTGARREALSQFREATRLSPGDAVALFNLCLVAAELGDPEPARLHLPRIRSHDPRLAAELEQALAKEKR